MDFLKLAKIWGDVTYAFLAANLLWGLFCAIVVWRRLAQLKFASEELQHQFVSDQENSLAMGDFDGAAAQCENDSRALPQLTLLAINNRKLGHAKLRQLVADHFQRDVLADLENRVSWLVTVIKAGPLLGLYGTVMGMMAAFGQIGTGAAVKNTDIANEISVALICTALGLTTAIPFTFIVANVTIKIRKLQDMVGLGLSRILDVFRTLST